TVAESVRAIGAVFPVARATLPEEIPARPASSLPRTQARPAAARHFDASELTQSAGDRASKRIVQLPDPPSVRAGVAPPAEHLSRLMQAIDSRPRVSNDAGHRFRVTAEPAQGSRLSRFAGHVPLLGRRHKRNDYVPPELVRESLASV